MLILLIVFSMIPVVSLTAYIATSAKTDFSAPCTVRIIQSPTNKRCKQYELKLSHDRMNRFSKNGQ